MRSSTCSFSPCSVKLIRNCIPSLHLSSTTSLQPTIAAPKKWPSELIEAVCIEAFGLTAQVEPQGKWVTTNHVKSK
ncbi:unnamed protein product [Adineta ricciae]|uniref:Uncharacterized protein n=1 Tax=Adineta ricciae TaxID=249248 RepID=A0A813R6N7_ADIRI|nr:unnamed protein product [Adineta ricciae]CAF1205102.1 unnamed protein product [Adineta ricciae]